MLIRLESVTYTYDPKTVYKSDAVKNISLEIDKNEYAGIIGHTGSGKSTLVQLFNGLMKPSSGHVFYDEKDIWGEGYDRRALRSHVGLVFQYPEHQFFEATVFEDVCFGPKNLKLSEEEVKNRAVRSLKDTGVPESIFFKSPFEISGGLKRRVAIAGVLAMEPEVLILDEPAAGLDPKGKREILGLISDLHKKRGITVILVSHSMEDIAEYTDRLIVLNKGEKVFDGSTREVFLHYKELEKMSLAAPQVTYIMHALKEKGLDTDVSAITVEEAKRSVLEALRRCCRC
ncbi:MAG TPA: energy-coupling factor transporter ATPase [Candidatus Alectryocaccobium stercorigallinarum]|nr:energy-coupling factor transporter ATPase [Candidatus Alectryocaccobium stercorigallinarum]